MKAVKIIVVAVLLAALGFGLYLIIAPSGGTNDNAESATEIVIPDGCDLEWAQLYIDSIYRAIPNGQFQALKKRRAEMQGNFDDMMTGSPRNCQETVKLMLRNRYQSRFITMANTEFEGKEWPHYSDIKEMNKALLTEVSQGSQDLKRIELICKEYGQVLSYNSRVKKQSYQRPSSLRDHWNFSNTRSLIANSPSVSAPVDHTLQYVSSKPGNVKTILYNGHMAFLEKLIGLARSEILDNRTDSNYNRVFDIVTNEIELFKTNAASLYGQGYSSVNGTADRLTNKLKSYESFLNHE